VRPRRLEHGVLGAVRVDTERLDQRQPDLDRLSAQFGLLEQFARQPDLLAGLRRHFGPFRQEAAAGALVAAHPPVDFVTLRLVGQAVHGHAQAKAIHDLRAQPTFLRVHRPHQHKARPVGANHRPAADGVAALSRRVEDGIHNQIVEQVHLVNVEQVLVGTGQNAQFQPHAALLHGDALVDATYHIFQPRVERKLDQLDRLVTADRLPCFELALAVRAETCRAVPFSARGQTPLRAQADLDIGQQVGQAAHAGRLAGAARPDQQHAADCRVDHRQQQGHAHFVLSHDCQKGEG